MAYRVAYPVKPESEHSLAGHEILFSLALLSSACSYVQAIHCISTASSICYRPAILTNHTHLMHTVLTYYHLGHRTWFLIFIGSVDIFLNRCLFLPYAFTAISLITIVSFSSLFFDHKDQCADSDLNVDRYLPSWNLYLYLNKVAT